MLQFLLGRCGNKLQYLTLQVRAWTLMNIFISRRPFSSVSLRGLGKLRSRIVAISLLSFPNVEFSVTILVSNSGNPDKSILLVFFESIKEYSDFRTLDQMIKDSKGCFPCLNTTLTGLPWWCDCTPLYYSVIVTVIGNTVKVRYNS